MTTTSDQAPTAAETVELNIFAKTAEGFDAHIKLTEVPTLKAVVTLESLSKALAKHGMSPQQRYGYANGNGRSTGNGAAAPTGPVCPFHGVAKPSKHGQGLYCPKRLPDGTYCRWRKAE